MIDDDDAVLSNHEKIELFNLQLSHRILNFEIYEEGSLYLW